MEKNILIVGVGGQGTLLASKILGAIAMAEGLDVKLSEVHGMAQRGGSVVTHVRMSDEKVYAPVIGEGKADVILAFELLEAYRWIHYLKPGGSVLVNSARINPMPVILGNTQYPDNIEAFLKENVEDLEMFDAEKIAIEAGSSRAVNTVMMGALANKLPFTRERWEDAIRATVKPQFVEMNLGAFAKTCNK